MNTADKSIALVDIALRRRFQFVPVYPNPEVIMKFCKSSDKEEKSKFMSALNLRLRNDKGVDFQIGHAYFLNENFLIDVINENIVPLLIEYFRNDLEKVRGLMKDLNRKIDEDHYNNTGLLKYIG
jgi:5-methylcytosine-specific restriction endonuclease McrBC GTP-binding regulatory subunit McrB